MSRALLLSPDDQAVSAITGVLEEMAVSCERPLDGVSAAQKLNSHNFDLVLVDCENLPAAKLIFDVCRRGKAGNTPVPIAIVDGRAGLPTAFRLGAELILTKPVSKDHARSTIRTAVGRVRKEETGHPAPALNEPGSKTAPHPSDQQAAAAAASAMTAPVAATPQTTKIAESVPTVAAAAAEPAQAPAAQMSTVVEETPVPATPPPVQPVVAVAPSRLSKRPLPAATEFKRAPEEKLGDDPVLAEIEKGETGVVVRQAPVLSSFNSPTFNPAPPKKRRGPVLLLLLLLAGGGFYAAWNYQPGFREMVSPQIERVIALVGQITQRNARPQPKASAPAPSVAKAPTTAAQPAVAANPTAVSNASAPSSSPETAAAAPASGATSAAATAAAGANPTEATTPQAVPATASATGTETAASPANSGDTAAPISLNKPPALDKNVVILSSKGAERRLLHKVPPVYPKEARAASLEGTVVLKVLVSDTGKVASVSLVEGNPILVTPAMRAVKQWHYRPYVRDGKNLAFETIVLMDFQRQ